MYFLPWAGMKFCETRLAYHYLPSLNGVCQPRYKSWQADTGRRKDGDTATTLGLFMLPPNLEAGWQLVFLLPRFAAGKMDCQDCHCKACTPALTWAPFRLGKQWYENVIDRTFTKSKQTMTKVEGGSTPRVVAGKIATWWDLTLAVDWGELISLFTLTRMKNNKYKKKYNLKSSTRFSIEVLQCITG